MFKKGISSIVVTVLMILLILVSTGILWIFVQPLFSQADTSHQQSCIALDLAAVSCAPLVNDANEYAGVQVKVRRGSGAVDMDKLRFLFSQGNDYVLIDKDSQLGELETATYSFSSQDLVFSPASVDVAGILGSGSLCQLTGPISCGDIAIEGGCGDGVKSGDEECDDGNQINDDGTCTNQCTIPVCDDGICSLGEDEDSCSQDCLVDELCKLTEASWVKTTAIQGELAQLVVKSTGVCIGQSAQIVLWEGDPVFDDVPDLQPDPVTFTIEAPNSATGDWTAEWDTDGFVGDPEYFFSAALTHSPEQQVASSVPLTVSQVPVCGNGVVEQGETCDDHNQQSGDGCSSMCQTEQDDGDWGFISDDCDALYQKGNVNRGDLQVTLLDGGKSFEVTRKNADGSTTKLRKQIPAEQFFTKAPQNALDVKYSIVDRSSCGGVDIEYTLTNTNDVGGKNLNMPYTFQVQGIAQTVDGKKDGWYLYPNDYGGMIKMYKQGGQFNEVYLGLDEYDGAGGGKGEIDQIKYPGVYSPVIATKDDSFATGSSLMYPYLKYNTSVAMTLLRDKNTNTWTHNYSSFINDITGGVSTLKPKETRKYVLSVRFTRPDSDYWLYTLAPYKEFFTKVYGPDSDIKPKDLHPILALQFADVAFCNSVTNPRGYSKFINDKPEYDLNDEGWGRLLTFFSDRAKTLGYKRSLFWAVSGIYPYNIKENNYLCDATPQTSCFIDINGKLNYGCNFAPQAVDTDINTKVGQTTNEFGQFNAKGISLGVWWGRSMQIPEKEDGTILGTNDWDAHHLDSVDFNNAKDLKFLEDEVKRIAALGGGVQEIGLDAFSGGYEKYYWIDKLKQFTQNKVNFVGEASQPDFVHSKIGNYYSPCKHVGLEGPDLLSYYLNPGAEIWVQFGGSFKKKGDNQESSEDICDEEYDNISTIDNLLKHSGWGYTRIIKGFDPKSKYTDVSGVNFKVYECFDGKNNGDGDNAVDFPFDPDCTSFTDNKE